jgi:hypothetical protein
MKQGPLDQDTYHNVHTKFLFPTSLAPTPGNHSKTTVASKGPNSNTTTRLPIQTQLKARYPVLDATGNLPFDIVFGLRRRSDSDTRDILFHTTHSILDVPYALAHGLARIHEVRRFSETKKSPEERRRVFMGVSTCRLCCSRKTRWNSAWRTVESWACKVDFPGQEVSSYVDELAYRWLVVRGVQRGLKGATELV